MKKWKVLRKKDVSPHKWFPIEQHTVEVHNDTIIDDYYISPIGDGAMVLAITKDHKIVLVKQYKHGFGDITYDLPAGFLQKGKTMVETAAAELEEESGIKVNTNDLTFIGIFCNVPSKIQHNTYSYLATDVEFNSSQKPDPLEEIEIVLKSPQEVITMIKDGKIIKSDVIATIMKAYLDKPRLFVVPAQNDN